MPPAAYIATATWFPIIIIKLSGFGLIDKEICEPTANMLIINFSLIKFQPAQLLRSQIQIFTDCNLTLIVVLAIVGK